MSDDLAKGLVLIVDDNAANRHLLSAILKKAGYTTEQCASGVECVAFCDQTQPQIILLDVMMPEMDGIQACKILRQKFGKEVLPIIMVTTRVSGSDLAAGFAAGASDYVTKPVDRTVLMSRIENQLRLIESQQRVFTANRNMEQALQLQRALEDALPQSVLVHNRAGKILYENQSFFLFGGGRDFGTIEIAFSALYQGQLIRQMGVERLREIICGVDDLREELRISVDGADRFISIISRPVLLDEGEALRLWVLQEVTRERELEQKMNQQMKMETVGLFASGVAHNFNNLFGSILGATDILKRAADNPERLKRCVQICEEAVSAGMQLTKKMYTAKASFRKGGSSEIARLGGVLDQGWKELSEHKNFEAVRFERSEELSHLLVAIPTEGILAICKDLFENALDAAVGEGVVRCSICSKNVADGLVTISIEDSGEGMDSETLRRVCEPFFSTRRMDHTNKVSVDGKGLGLWNVYNVVKLAGGDIVFESSPGAGTTVFLSLPVVAETEVKEVPDQENRNDTASMGESKRDELR